MIYDNFSVLRIRDATASWNLYNHLIGVISSRHTEDIYDTKVSRDLRTELILMEMKKRASNVTKSKAALKFFLLLYSGLMALVIAVSFLVYQYETSGDRKLIELNERLRLAGLEREIALNIQSVISDLLVLAEDDEFFEVIEGRSKSAIWTVTEDFTSFITSKRSYDQIRFIGMDGMEMIRVNWEDKAPYAVPHDELQNKAGRYYFKDVLDLKNGQVYMSQLDLNIEHQEVERPYKPMIRFGTPIFDRSGKQGGVLLINYLAETFLDRIISSDEDELSQTYLLNGGGYILQGPVQEQRWGFMFQEGTDRTFANYFPELWARIVNEISGQADEDGEMFTFKRVILTANIADGSDIVRGPDSAVWYLVSRIPKENLHAGYNRILMWLSILVGILAAILAGVCWLLAAIRAKHFVAEERIRQSLVEKEVLLREIHHRVKNNLQVISGMLELQAALVKDPSAKSSLKEGRNRVMSMALIHQKLYQSEDIAQVHMDSYLKSLVDDLFAAFGVDEERISMRIEAQAVRLNLDTAIPLGLLVSELVTNALKYAFPADGGGGKGEIAVFFNERDDGRYSLSVSDNGIGLPGEFNLDTASSLGLKLVHTLVEQLDGEVTLDRDSGTTWAIVCPPYQGAEGLVANE